MPRTCPAAGVRLAGLALLLPFLLLGGCSATLATDLAVDRQGQVSGALEVAFTGDAAAAVSQGQARIELESALRRAGLDPDRTVRDGNVVYRATLREPLSSLAHLTGVAAVRPDPAGGVVEVDLTSASGLQEAVAAAVSGEPDADALAAALTAATTLELRLSLPGEVAGALFVPEHPQPNRPDGPAPDPVAPTAETDGRTVVLAVPADRLADGTVEVAYEPQSAPPLATFALGAAAVTGGLVAVGLLLWRRR